VALLNGDVVELYDVGKPDFLGHKQRLTGHVLRKPTLTERLARDGGEVIFNNVSQGAAYMHDLGGMATCIIAAATTVPAAG
jgi:hypothetical protein